MIEEDLLTRLPDAGYSTTVRPMPQIVERAAEMRRGRRFRRIGTAGGVAALAALVTVTGVQFFSGPNAVMPASGGAADCNSASADTSGYAYREKVSALAELVHLPAESTTGALTGSVLPRRETSNCAFAPPQAVAYATAPAMRLCPVPSTCADSTPVVSRRLEVGRPDPANRYDPDGSGSGGHFEGRVTHPVIQGQPADLYGIDGTALAAQGLDPMNWLYLFWTDADGSSHELSSAGISRAQLVAAAQAVEFDDDGVADTGSLPPGFTTWADLPSMPPKSASVERRIEFSFKGTGGEAGWALDVRDRPDFNVAPYGGEAVSIGDAHGWWNAGDAGGGKPGHGRLTWLHDGVQFELSGNNAPITRTQALAVARSVVKAQPDDPRITAAGVK